MRIKIETVPINDINPAPYNSRIDLGPNDLRYKKLKQSLEVFGYVEPLVWNRRTGTLISGHQRLKILSEQGLTAVEVSVVDMPIEEEKQLNLILNKVRGDWDEEKLSVLLDELSHIPNFDVTLTGFDVPEISEILDAHRMPDAEDDFDADAAVEAIDEPITKLGELIEVGGHRVFCGDSGNFEDLQKLMGNEKASLLDTDPPFNVNYNGGDNPSADTRPKKSKKWDKIYSDDLPQAEYESWMKKVFSNIKGFLHPGAAIYVWQGHRQLPPLYQILLDLNFYVSSIIVWLKPSIAFSYGDYSFRSEHALYGWLQGAPHYFAGEPGEANVWEIKRDSTKTYQHPTQKPVALRQRSVKNSSKRGDVILDTFLGSGSLLLACESLGRRCYGIELDPRYVDVIVRRYLNFVGRDKAPQDLWNRYMKGTENGK